MCLGYSFVCQEELVQQTGEEVQGWFVTGQWEHDWGVEHTDCELDYL